MKEYRAIFHLDEKNRGEMVLHNIENLLNDLGEKNVEVELLANGQGVRVLLKKANPIEDLILRLAERGVRFAACSNSIRYLGFTKDELFDVVEIVPSGVGELVKKQTQGWAYIRP